MASAERDPLTDADAAGGERVGPYRLLRRLGEGGMGLVYEAEQLEPFHRRVAIKFLRLEVSSDEVIARFDAERQALAAMSHESIAKVYEAGTSGGRPWFAMELVRGIPITEFSDANALAIRDRVAMMIAVCRGVQHAHQKGVIHRDLKPANVMVTEVDGRPVPKIIDFGIAKAVGQRLTDRVLVTHFGQAVGTPAYMSPEQAGTSGLDVDTRTDVYSLGVMLYELVVGRLPVDPDERGLEHFMLRLSNRAVDVPTPSARYASLASDGETLARLRRTSPDGLRRALRGDLDWIVLKAMDPDRNRRYETANGLAMDLERMLANEPVAARPPSASYRLRKFVGRHRAAAAAGISVVLALVAGATAATVGLVRANRAEARARLEAQAAREVSQFFSGVFTASIPDRAGADVLTARQLLDSSAVRLEKELASQPPIQARLMRVLGSVYHDLGLFPESERLLREAMAIVERTDATEEDRAAVLTSVGELLTSQGKYASAESSLVRALATLPQETASNREVRAAGLSSLGRAYFRMGRYEDARARLDTAIAEWRALAGPESEKVMTATISLANVIMESGKPLAAESLFRRVLASRERTLGPDHRLVANAMSTLAGAVMIQARSAEAESLYRRALEIETRVLGPTHNVVAIDLYNLGTAVGDQGRYAEGTALLRRAQQIWEARFGPEHPFVASALGGQADQHRGAGRFAQAIPLLQRAEAIKVKTLAPSHPSLAATRYSLGETYRSLRQYDLAARYLTLALEAREQALDPSSDRIFQSLSALGRLYRDSGLYQRADSLFARARAQWAGSGRPRTAALDSAARDHVGVLRRLGRNEEAAALLRQAQDP